MKVVIAMDSFKGSLSSPAACSAVEEGLRAADPSLEITGCPLADGGEGTARILCEALSGEWRSLRVCGPLAGREVEAGYAWIPATGTAVIEMAEASGLTLLGEEERDPMSATTLGTGQLVADAMRRGVRRILMGVGGSATVDGGVGAATALGWQFLDRTGNPIGHGGGRLSDLHRIVVPERVELPAVEVLCDVTNPLLGPQGAAAVFGPQKGATPEQVVVLEEGLAHLAACTREQCGVDLTGLAGAGAAGGLAAGAVAFFNAKLVSGIETVMDCLGLSAAMAGADWVITGEGRFDAQSLAGKVVSGVGRMAACHGTRMAVLAGSVALSEADLAAAGIELVEAASPAGMPLEEAMARGAELLRAAAARLQPGMGKARGT